MKSRMMLRLWAVVPLLLLAPTFSHADSKAHHSAFNIPGNDDPNDDPGDDPNGDPGEDPGDFPPDGGTCSTVVEINLGNSDEVYTLDYADEDSEFPGLISDEGEDVADYPTAEDEIISKKIGQTKVSLQSESDEMKITAKLGKAKVTKRVAVDYDQHYVMFLKKRAVLRLDREKEEVYQAVFGKRGSKAIITWKKVGSITEDCGDDDDGSDDGDDFDDGEEDN